MTREQRPAARRGGARIVAPLLPGDLKRAFRARGFVETAVLTEWPAIVGDDLAARCVPESLGRDGALRVRAQGAAAPELQHMAPRILERVATFFGYRAATRLVILHGAPRRSPKRPREAARPLTAEETERIADLARRVEDAELRAALERLGRQVVARR
jgi:hypothetical protein